MMKIKFLMKNILIFQIAAVLSPGVTWATIQGSPHDLSATGYGTGDTCSFCHTPHGAAASTPLWNRKLSEAVYDIYQSSSLEAEVAQPTGASKLCLSCHDGTIALTETLSSSQPGSTYIPPGDAHLGTDLSDDHPISFVYSQGLSSQDAQIRLPGNLPPTIRLDQAGEVQCTTCHNPHDNEFGDFLVMSNAQSVMCTSCHDMKGWDLASHQSSDALVASADDTYLQNSPYTSVSENACGNCHRPHSAGGHERLLHFENSEDNCLSCHNGSVATTDLRASLTKLSRHDVEGYFDVHDPRETAATSEMHVECVDCHNPHACEDAPADPPMAPGALKGVSGITAQGSPIQEALYEYEICFKCHGDNPNRPLSEITRQITQTNTRMEFDPINPSYHPVVTAGVNPNVPSLMPDLTVNSIINCTDCHSSNDPSGPRGPHGSDYVPLLAYRYETADGTQESLSAYELCYRCHSRNSILNDESFSKHRKHINKAPCSICHDPHGISSSPGNSINNSHLINFDLSIVSPDPATGRLEFVDKGTFQGECFLTCHNKKHSAKSY